VDAIEPATAAKTGETRRQGIRGLVVAAVLIPVLVGIGTWAGGALGKPLVRLHEDWAMADQLAAEDGGANQTAVSKAFRNGPRSRKQLDEDVAARQARLSYGGRWVGAFLGLVIGMRLLSLRIRWRREGYEPDRADCVSCGRCFAFCPRERIRENADADG
jgi:ferredoxin